MQVVFFKTNKLGELSDMLWQSHMSDVPRVDDVVEIAQKMYRVDMHPVWRVAYNQVLISLAEISV